jgi:dinuclear metal center YbgI/SA1388 family protein
MTDVREVATYLDDLLQTSTVQDYPGALNGLQLANDVPVTGVAAAVDFSRRAVEACIEQGGNLLIVHHGMFWQGVRPFVGSQYRRIKLLLDNQIAVYSSHLPLDMHANVGNNVLLAAKLGLTPSRGFAHSKGVAIGVAGDAEILTSDLVNRAKKFVAEYQGSVVTTANTKNRMTRKWGLCTGAGAGSDTLDEARNAGIDTLIVGEGPHWTAVAAEDEDLCVIYAGHYATETPGVQAIAARVAEKFSLPWSFINLPTGL